MKTVPSIELFDKIIINYVKDYNLNTDFILNQLNIGLADLYIIRDLQQVYKCNSNAFCAGLLLLCHKLNSGSLCLFLNVTAMEKLANFIGANANDVVDVFFALDLSKNSPLLISNQKLYFQIYANHSSSLEGNLKRLISIKPKILKNKNDVVTKVINNIKYPLDKLQIDAIHKSVSHQFSIISGGPGTGKTTVMTAVLRCIVRLYNFDINDIKLVAPTGRAAKRMGEALKNAITKDLTHIDAIDKNLLKLEPKTLHSLLGANPSRRNFLYNSSNRLLAKLIIIDEVSMVDLVLMDKFITSMSNECILILLGDQFQLPSVGAGAVLADLMPPITCEIDSKDKSIAGCVTVLKTSQRCQKDIAQFSEYIKFGNIENAFAFLKQNNQDNLTNNIGVFYHQAQQNQIKLFKDFYLNWFKQYFLTGENCFKKLLQNINIDFDTIDNSISVLDNLFKSVYANRVLCAVRKGIYGCDNINQTIVDAIKQELNQWGRDSLFHGVVIMISENNMPLRLYNGDTGIVLYDKISNCLRVVFEDGITYRSIPVSLLPAYQLAFAITVHKSQGSEFDRILIALPDDVDNKLLTREILYTGLTRAKRRVDIFATKPSLCKAITTTLHREGGLDIW